MFLYLCVLIVFSVISVLCVFLQYFVFTGRKTQPTVSVARNLYCVGGDVKPCTINQSVITHQYNEQDALLSLKPNRCHFIYIQYLCVVHLQVKCLCIAVLYPRSVGLAVDDGYAV